MSLAFSERLKLPIGTIIQCSSPFCRETIGRLEKEFGLGSTRLEFVEGSGQGSRVDRQPRCKKCNFKYVVSESDLMRVHTARGWFPEARAIEEMTEEVLFS